MSNSVRPHRRQPTRLPRPWDSQTRTLEWVAISFSNAWKGKVKVKSLGCVQLSWNSLGQNTGVGSLSLLQGIFPTQDSNRDLLHCRWIVYQLGYQGRLKRSLVFPILLFSFISLHWSLGKAFLSFLAILWNSAFRCVYLSFSPLSLASLLFSAIRKASSDNHFAFLCFFLGDGQWLGKCRFHPLMGERQVML